MEKAKESQNDSRKDSETEKPNTERPPGDWQSTVPEKDPEPREPGIVDPRRETNVPGEIEV